MRSRTPTLLWLPFVFSIGAISWALLLAGLTLFAAIVITPALKDVKDAQATRNDYQATLDLLDQKIALQKDFLVAAPTDTLLMDRLANRQLNRNRPDQEILNLDPDPPAPADSHDRRNPPPPPDRSIESLLAQSLTPPPVQKVAPIPTPLDAVLAPGARPLLTIIACSALALSFFLGVKYERH